MMKGVYDQVLNEGKENEGRCQQLLWKKLSIYRHENLRNRESKETPRSFEIQPELELKLKLEKEKLDNQDHLKEEVHAS